MRNLKKLAVVGATAAMTMAMSMVAMAATDVTIHFKNAANWDNVGAWAYEGVAFTTQVMTQEQCPAYNPETGRAIWPGAKLEAEQDYDGWYTATFTYEDLATNGGVIIFNNLVADTKADTASGGDDTDDIYLQASPLIKDSTKKKQTGNQIIKKGSTATEYWCDFDGVIPGSTQALLDTKPASYVKKASTVVDNVAATATSDKTIKLTWDKYKGAASYNVFYYNKKWVKVGSTKTNSFEVSKVSGKKLVTGKAYKFMIKAVKNNKGVASSNEVLGCALATPSVASAKNSAKSTVTVKAKAVAKADGYVIYRSTKEKGTYEMIGATKSGKVTFNDKTAKKGKTFFYKVAAYRTASGTKLLTQMSAKAVKVKVSK